jgi:uncharacterized protein (DUF1499 family)
MKENNISENNRHNCNEIQWVYTKEKRKYAQLVMAIYTGVPEVTIVNNDPDVISAYIISKIIWAWAKR